METIKYFSTFSGIGGFEKGIQTAYEKQCLGNESLCDADGSEDGGSKTDSPSNEGQGLQPQTRKEASSTQRPVSERNNNQSNERPLCIGYSEIDKYATQIYQRHFPNHINYGDITKINEKELPDFDLLVGGFPCQAFSIAGKRGGFEDTRGTMFFELARILREKQPRLFVFENVKGLLSHDKGDTFRTIISTLDELGYDCQWQVLNSKNHGVPQNRERVFIIGHLRGTPRPEVFPFGEANQVNDRESQSVSRETKSFTEKHLKNNPNLNESVLEDGENRPLRIRRLTPTECERLQGFPDGWTEGISDTQRYKCLGNAVTVNVITDICEKLLRS